MEKYSIIYADPPWHYKTYSPKGNGRSAEKHYPTMSITEIKALPVEKLAAEDCALFMWITFPCMKEAFEVLEAQVGRIERGLVESVSTRDAASVGGKTPRGHMVNFAGGKELIGRFADVEITSAGRNTLRGRLMNVEE